MKKNLAASGILVLFAIMDCAYANQGGPQMPPAPAAAQPPGESAGRGGEKETYPVFLQRRNPRYRLSKGDTFDLDFPFTPEFNQTVIVQPDGFISLRGAGDLRVEGLTIPELTESLRASYARILRQPVISVLPKDFDKPFFIAGGEVGHPGKYDLRGDTTVTQAVAIAGGLNDTAQQSQVLLFRRVSDQWVEVKNINLKQVLHAQNLNEDPRLRPGDMIFVPKSRLSRLKRYIPTPGLGLYFNPNRF